MDVALRVRGSEVDRERSQVLPAAAIAAGVTLVSIAAVLGASAATERQPASALLRASMVAAPLAAGAFAWRLAPYQRFARLLVLAGLAAFVTTFAESPDALLYSVGRTGAWFFEVVLITLLLTFPTGRLEQRVDQRLLAAMVAVVSVCFVPTLLLARDFKVPAPYTSCTADCPRNVFFAVDHQPALVDALLRPAGSLLVLLVMCAVLVRLRARIGAATPVTRRLLVPLLAIGMARAVLLGLTMAGREVSPDSGIVQASSWLLAATAPAFAIAFLGGMVRWRLFAEQALRRLADCVRGVPDAATLRRALSDALGDPSAELVLPAAGRPGAWVDARGAEAPAPRAGSGRAVREVGSDGVLLGVIVHDEGLAAQPALMDATAALAAVALDNRRLIEETRSAMREVHRSRARIAASADAERRRIERDLHDGAQQRLVALRIELGLAEELAHSDPDACAARLQQLEGAVEETLEELRALAHGVCPPLLADRGLPDALRAVLGRCTVPGRLEVREVGRYAPEIESAVYFCVLEALQNVDKHARGAHRVVVTLDGRYPGELRFGVRDDGAGAPGALEGGAGITNMQDRMDVLGGELRIVSRPNIGTEVRGIVPAGDRALA